MPEPKSNAVLAREYLEMAAESLKQGKNSQLGEHKNAFYARSLAEAAIGQGYATLTMAMETRNKGVY